VGVQKRETRIGGKEDWNAPRLRKKSQMRCSPALDGVRSFAIA
jgi:hypothetical protein